MKAISRLFVLTALILLVTCCTNGNNDTTASAGTMEKIAGLAILTRDGTTIELPDVYDSLVKVIPEKDTVKFSRILNKGFILQNSGWGNHMRGPHLLQFVFRKGDCECTVSKIYYDIARDSVYQVAESINCKTITKK